MVCSEAEGVSSPTTIFTQKVGSVPSGTTSPSALRSSKLAVYAPSSGGAVRSIEISTVELISVSGTGTDSGAFILSPDTKAIVYPVHGQEPVFWSFHVLVNGSWAL